jgi:very-short-patch-repair endonuclease
VDGTKAHGDQLARYSQRLEVYRDRLLHVDWRNRAVLLRRTEKRWTLDLATHFKDDPEQVDEILAKATRTKGTICLVKDSDLSERADDARSWLVQLERTSRLIFEETGVRDFYLGFPFLVGKAGKESAVRAPLILFPVEIERRREGICGWYLSFSDEEPILNRALIGAIRQGCGITFPDEMLDEAQDLADGSPKEDVASHLILGMQGILRHNGLELRDSEPNEFAKGLEAVTRESLGLLDEQQLHLEGIAIIGSFPQGSTAIFRDYEDMLTRVQQGGGDQGIVDDLLEAPALREGRTEISKAIDIDSVPDNQIDLALPTDSSQDSVILESQSSECVVVRGPPGTGKSQVIVNLITNALAKDQKVLVVCQKRAALDVVYQRLGRVGLSEVAVLLHDARGDRQGAYAALAKRMEGDPPPEDQRLEREIAEASSQIDLTIAELNSIVKPMWTEYFGGARLQELYTAAQPGFMPRLQMEALANRLSKQSLTGLLQKMPGIQTGHIKFDAPASPLSKRKSFASLNSAVKYDLQASIMKAESLALSSPMTLDDVQQQSAAIASLDDYEALRTRFLRFLNGRWRRANRQRKLISSIYPSDPRLSDAASLKAALTHGNDLLVSLEDLRSVLRQDGFEEIKMAQRNPPALRDKLEAIRLSLDEFDAVQEYDRTLASLDATGSELVDLCRRSLPVADAPWARMVEQEVVARWIAGIESRNPQLAGDPFRRYLELKFRLHDLLKKRRDLFVRRLALKVLRDAKRAELPPGEHHPNKRPETDWNRLLAEFNKKRRVKSVRSLLEEFPFQMMRVAPCWLVSPEAGSEVLPLTKGLFDLVVFDESSQLAVERSLPAIYRGRRVVIAGDEKQLRPFDLFRSKDDEEELDEVTEAESLLVLAMRVFTPRYLSWHYRSRYQELIDFSNHAFYDGNLEIAANVDRSFPAPPIEFVRVNGSWDERTNDTEAQKVVDIITALLAEGEKAGRLPSIGVITFNEPQRDLIEDVIDERRQRSKDFERLFSEASSNARNLDDRPFVKNIENVQGDERDVILFSVGYAPDRQGRFRVQFGSLSQEGGENRLNVAVTRAREKVVMVASFDPASLPVDDVKNLGPRRLKDYLVYAHAVSEEKHDAVSDLLAKMSTTGKKIELAQIPALGRPLEDQVKEALEAKGYKVDAKVGFSGYRIDLAVVDPSDESRYVLGIECDGGTFHSARSARERDVVRQAFLEDRGWEMDRVWSRNWWRNRDAELLRLEGRIRALSKEKSAESKKTAPRIGKVERKEKDVNAEGKGVFRDRSPESFVGEAPGAEIAEGRDDRSMKFIFYQQLAAGRSKSEVQAAESMLDWTTEQEMRFWWREFHGVTTVTPYFKHGDSAHWFFSLRADGNVDLHFQYLKPPFESKQMRFDLIHRLNVSSGLNIPEDYASRIRTVRLSWLTGEGSLDGFIKVLQWYVNEVKKT